MASDMSIYTAATRWKLSTMGFEYETFDRTHTWRFRFDPRGYGAALKRECRLVSARVVTILIREVATMTGLRVRGFVRPVVPPGPPVRA